MSHLLNRLAGSTARTPTAQAQTPAAAAPKTAPPAAKATAQTAAPKTTAQAAAPKWGPKAREFARSVDGTPIFKQGDGEWGTRLLGEKIKISKSGCAMTSTAMALSKIRGEVITPKQLDAYLDKNNGYATEDALKWFKAGFKHADWSLKTLDESVKNGRPVVIGVDYKAGSSGGANGTDHWICVTAKVVGKDGKVVYHANDPGTGKVIYLKPDGKGGLTGDGADALGAYRSSRQMRTFDPAFTAAIK